MHLTVFIMHDKVYVANDFYRSVSRTAKALIARRMAMCMAMWMSVNSITIVMTMCMTGEWREKVFGVSMLYIGITERMIVCKIV
jgi:hypothetical protein